MYKTLTCNLIVGSFTLHTTPNAQIFKNFSGQGKILSTERILASSTVIIRKSGGVKTYPLYQPSPPSAQIKSWSACGLKS